MNRSSTISRPATAASDGATAIHGKSTNEDSCNALHSFSSFFVVVSYVPRPHVFLFVNPTSGGNAAGCLMQGRGDDVFELTDLNGRLVKLQVADIRVGETGNKPLFLKLKKLVEDMKREQIEERVTVIMAGGDGTVLWGISEIWAHEIDDSYIVFGTIPFGTGNDFAKALNWNSINVQDPYGADLQQLKSLVTAWNESPVIIHDIWDIVIQLRTDDADSERSTSVGQDGPSLLNMRPTSGSAAAAAAGGACFMQIDSSSRYKKVLCDASGRPITTLNKKLNNYFSLGIESRIGIGFDRHRKTSALKNKIIYVNEGLKKSLFHKPVNINKFVRNMKTTDPTTGRLQTVFSSNPDNMTQRKLRSTASLIALNIPSFASGLDVWKNAHRIGLKDPVTKIGDNKVRHTTHTDQPISIDRTGSLTLAPAAVYDDDGDEPIAPGVPGVRVKRQKSVKTRVKRCVCCACIGPQLQGDLAVLAEAQQLMGDAKLEWVSFGTITSLGTEQVLEGLGRRIHQGSGPFILNFNEDLTADERIYFQIDGEFYIMLKPLTMVIRHYRKIACLANGGIRAGQIMDASLVSAQYQNTSSSDSLMSQS